MFVEIRIRFVTAAAAPATGANDGQVAVLDEVVLAEPDLVEPELVEPSDLVDGLGVDVVQRVVAAGRAAEVVGDAEPHRRGHADEARALATFVSRSGTGRPLESPPERCRNDDGLAAWMAMSDGYDEQAEIRTPDQRLRVFVSSTLAELADERAAVARAISALRLTPVLFELGARPHPPRELYRAYLAQSDIFVGLYWQRYGWIGPGMDISGLEDEFRLSHSIPRLLYVKTPAPEREPGLTAMIEELQSEGTDSYRSFRTPRELGRLVRDDLALLLSERFATAGGAAARRESPSASS